MEKTDATTMVNVIKDIVLRLGWDKAKLRGQCYYGCSTMMRKKGVVTLIKRDVQAFTLSTHCYKHPLNLACGDWFKNSTVASNLLDTSYEITKLLKFSPKRNSRLRKIHEEEYYKSEGKRREKMQTLELFSQTLWTVRGSSLTSIGENYKELEELWNWFWVEYEGKQKQGSMVYKLKCEHFVISSGWGLTFFFLDIVMTWARPFKLKICAPPKERR